MTEIRMTKTNNTVTQAMKHFVLDFEHSDFDIVSDFVLRASDFTFLMHRSVLRGLRLRQ